MTEDKAKKDHWETLQSLTARGGPIHPFSDSATHNRVENFRSGGSPTPARARLHKQILDEYFAEKPSVERGRRSIIMAGPPGAGKTSARLERIPRDEEHKWRFIDADEFKERLIKKMEASGEFEAIIPPAVKERIENGEKFLPGEFAALVHEESSILARNATARSLRMGENVVLDGVNGDADKLRRRLDELQEYEYESAELLAVDGSMTATRGRVERRWSGAYDRAHAGDSSQGYHARFVPDEITESLYQNNQAWSSVTPAVSEVMKNLPEGMTVGAKVYYVESVDSAAVPWRTYDAETGKVTVLRKVASQPWPPAGGPAPQASSPGDDSSGGSGGVVSGYTKKDGTVVGAYTRKKRT